MVITRIDFLKTILTVT